MFLRQLRYIVAISIGFTSGHNYAEEGPQTIQTSAGLVGPNGTSFPSNTNSNACTMIRINEYGQIIKSNGCVSNSRPQFHPQSMQTPQSVTILMSAPLSEPVPLKNLYRIDPGAIYSFKNFECSGGYPTRYPIRNHYNGTTLTLQDNTLELKTKLLQEDQVCEITATKSLVIDEHELETKNESLESNCLFNPQIGKVERFEYKFEQKPEGKFLKLAPINDQQPTSVAFAPCLPGERLFSVYEMVFLSQKNVDTVVPSSEELRPPPKPKKPYMPKKIDFSRTRFCRNEAALDKLPISRDRIAKYIVVSKKRKRIYVLGTDSLIGQYKAAFGKGFADGPKEFQSDSRTPEGLYSISSKTTETNYHRALVVSYPNKADHTFAREQDRSAGGDIMIHGFPSKSIAGETPESVQAKHPNVNWTLGCMAVTNREIEEIYDLVPEKSSIPIEICPL